MCIVFLYFCDKPSDDGYHLIIASNRDEYYFRPTACAKFWDKNPNIIAGMDLEPGKEGGTWLGLNKDGKFAAITNYRQGPKFINANAIGRGFLVPDFLEGDSNVREYLQGVRGKADQYNGFNLLVGKLSLTADSKVGWYCNIEEKEVKMLSPGIHVLSNKVLNCSWPKMVYGRQRFDHILDETCTKQELIDKLMGLLRVQQRSFSCGNEKSFIGYQDEDNDINYVNACRSIFVNYKEKKYGTRTNTVVLVDAKGHATYVESTMEDNATDPDQAKWKLSTYEFDIDDTDIDDTAETVAKENVQLNESVEKYKGHNSTEKTCAGCKTQPRKRVLINGTSSAEEPASKVSVKE